VHSETIGGGGTKMFRRAIVSRNSQYGGDVKLKFRMAAKSNI